MATLNPYLNFPGTTEEAFNLYKSVFGGEFIMVQRFKDVPGTAENVSPADANKIMHIALPLGKDTILMATDALESMGQKLTYGNNTHLCYSPDSEKDADRVFKGLSEGGKVTMPMEKMFWGAYFGMVNDRYGISWMINYELPK